MANIKLSDLRKQQAGGTVEVIDGLERLVVAPEGVLPNPAWESAPGRFPGLEPDAFKPLNIGPPPVAAGPAPVESLPLQASSPVSAATAGGYCRIYPASFPSIGVIPQVWKDENWAGPSPWCHVEGTQPHPDFESNLLLVEAELDKENGFCIDK